MCGKTFPTIDFNHIKDWGEGVGVESKNTTNVGISPKNVLTFCFDNFDRLV